MAFCPNCGERLPDSAAFCPGCGSPIAARPAAPAAPEAAPAAPFYPSEPAYSPEPSYYAPSPAPAPAKKKKTGLIIGLIAGLVLIGVVLLILFLTGVLGGGAAKADLIGEWTLVESTDPGSKPGDIVLTLEGDGSGSGKIYGLEMPLTWDRKGITLNGVTLPLELKDDMLILEDDGQIYRFAKGEPEAPAPSEEPAPAEPPASVFQPLQPTPEPELPFPFGTWTGSYVYNTNFFQVVIDLNEDYTCRRETRKNGEVIKNDPGVFEYSDNEIRLYLNGKTNEWTAYAVTGEMMVNNNHEFFRKDPGGVIGGWIGDYIYDGKHIVTYYILRSDMTYSEVTYRDGQVVTDEDGKYTFDGATVVLRSNNNPNISTAFDYVNDTLVNNGYVYIPG